MLIEIVVAVSAALLIGLCPVLAFTHQPRRHPFHRLVEQAKRGAHSRRER
jgi:hypothetical protein